jgi:hypothetical protein
MRVKNRVFNNPVIHQAWTGRFFSTGGSPFS